MPLETFSPFLIKLFVCGENLSTREWTQSSGHGAWLAPGEPQLRSVIILVQISLLTWNLALRNIFLLNWVEKLGVHASSHVHFQRLAPSQRRSEAGRCVAFASPCSHPPGFSCRCWRSWCKVISGRQVALRSRRLLDYDPPVSHHTISFRYSLIHAKGITIK